MNERGKMFWRDALLSGTKIGIVSVLLSIVVLLVGNGSAGEIFSLLERVVFFTLIFVFVRKHSWKYAPEEGFSFGRAFGFVLAMLLFVGVIQGVYSAILANYFMGPELVADMDKILLVFQEQNPNLYTPEMLEQLRGTMHTMTFNPFAATLSAVLGVEISGIFIALLVAVFTYRRVDLFAGPKSE
jgi:uncharacterized membrane protein (DUF106 family)